VPELHDWLHLRNHTEASKCRLSGAHLRRPELRDHRATRMTTKGNLASTKMV